MAGHHEPWFASSLLPIERPPHVEDDWPGFEENFYRDPVTGEWVYKYADQRIIACERVTDSANSHSETRP